jgi:hypothetical protein
MLTTRLIEAIAKSNRSISEQVALEHIDMDPAPSAPTVPLLSRKPLETNSERTLEILSMAAGNPYRYEQPVDGRSYCRPCVLNQKTTVGDAMLNLRNRLTHLTALLQAFDVPMAERRQNGTLRDAVVDLIHEVCSNFSVIEIAVTEDYHRHLKNSTEAV